MTTGETSLEMTTRHVAEQEARIVGHQALVAHLTKIGAPVDKATDLLLQMQLLLSDMRKHVASLEKDADASHRRAVAGLGRRPSMVFTRG